MHVYRLPEHPEALLFDIDGTLYRNDAYARDQLDAIVGRFAVEQGIPIADAWDRVNDHRRSTRRLTGKTPSLGNTFLEFGVPIAKSAEWRREVVDPEHYLKPDRRLAEALTALSGGFRLAALTNNPTDIGLRTLDCLGVRSFFPLVIGLDRTLASKPDPRALEIALESLGLAADRVVSIGDRFEVDLEPVLERGGGAILVTSMEDVYRLPKLGGLASRIAGVAR